MIEDGQQEPKSRQHVFAEQVFHQIKTGDINGLVQTLIEISVQLTGISKGHGKPGDGMYDVVVNNASDLINDFQVEKSARLVFYLADGGMSRLAIWCRDDQISIEPTSNSMSRVKEAWDALATSY